jgi:hypothetical protein
MGQRYVIAIKREKREIVAADWVEQLSLVEGGDKLQCNRKAQYAFEC